MVNLYFILIDNFITLLRPILFWAQTPLLFLEVLYCMYIVKKYGTMGNITQQFYTGLYYLLCKTFFLTNLKKHPNEQNINVQ